MKYRGHTVCIIDEDTNLEDIHDIQNKTEKSLLIYVPLCGVNDIYLYPERFIIENFDASLRNHFAWEELFTQQEQDERMYKMIDDFIDMGKQTIIENYEFVQDEPFYDYSGGR
jgi:hypothetical protein